MSKRNKIIYWISTVWLALGMLSSGIIQVMQLDFEVEAMTHLGYPVYFMTIIGIWKILGTIAILVPKYPLLKEWAYAGFFFMMTGAVYSHIANGDGFGMAIPAMLLVVLTVVSSWFRPEGRRLV